MLKRTIVALLGLSVLLFCVTYAARSNNNTNKDYVTEDYVVSPQADIYLATYTIAAVDTNAQIQDVSDNNAAAEVQYVARRTYNARASWYRHGRVTANGERYDPLGLSVAHRSLPFGTMVRFTNPETGQSVTVRVNDRGPYIHGREFDLSLGAAKAIGIEQRGVMVLKIEVF